MIREKEDLRITKTKRSLRLSILELVTAKPIDQVSVIDICDTALVNRMTFYKYYQDKFELFNDAIENVKQEILSGVDTTDDGSKEKALKIAIDVLDSIFKYYIEHRSMISGITANCGPLLSTSIAQTGMSALTVAFERKEGNLSSRYPADLIASCVYGGFIGLVEYTLKNPNKFSKKNIRDYLNSLESDIILRNYNLA